MTILSEEQILGGIVVLFILVDVSKSCGRWKVDLLIRFRVVSVLYFLKHHEFAMLFLISSSISFKPVVIKSSYLL
jgi:glucose-6-phosphate-specific signal transduction histidine kinase